MGEPNQGRLGPSTPEAAASRRLTGRRGPDGDGILSGVRPSLIMVVVTGVALAAAGCSSGTAGSGHHGSGTLAVRDSVVPSTPSTPSEVQCTLYERSGDARVQVSGGQGYCGTLARDLSSAGDYWSRQAQPPQGALGMVCAMTDVGVVAWVYDSGGQFTGQQVCSWFLSAGWAEDTAAESAAAAASASASAAAALEARRAADQRAAEQAVGELSSDIDAVTSPLSTLRSDRKQADADLAGTQHDARRGPGSDCYNAQTVDYDAADNVGYDVTDGMSYDRNEIRDAISAARQAIEDVTSALNVLNADGLPAPIGADRTVRAARTAITSTVAAANTEIDRGNADLSSAYQIANGIASGACAGTGPGSVSGLLLKHLH